MSKKITKKERKQNRQLSIQVRRVQKLENYMIEHVDPPDCPAQHHFSEKICCREVFLPAGTLITGTLYKIECFWILAKGKLRVVEGDHTRDITAPSLEKNVVGQKNSWYAFEESLVYGFIPNPDNSRDIETIINIFSDIDANELHGMPNNKQQANSIKRLENHV